MNGKASKRGGEPHEIFEICEGFGHEHTAGEGKAAGDLVGTSDRSRVGSCRFETFFTPASTVENDGASVLDDPAWPGTPFDGEGVPLDDVTWVDQGKLTTLRTTRYWAEHTGRPYAPYPGTIGMDGTDLSVDDLIGKGLEMGVISEFLLYTSASLVPMALPLAVLLASLMTFGNLAENLELLALKSSGISVVSGRAFSRISSVVGGGAADLQAGSTRSAKIRKAEKTAVTFDIRRHAWVTDNNSLSSVRDHEIGPHLKAQCDLTNDVGE